MNEWIDVDLELVVYFYVVVGGDEELVYGIVDCI